MPRWGRHGVELHNPEFDLLKPGDDPALFTGWVPVYERLGPLSPRRLRATLLEILGGLAAVPDPLPADTAPRQGLPPRLDALRAAHRPAADLTAR